MELSIKITEDDFLKDESLFTKLKGLIIPQPTVSAVQPKAENAAVAEPTAAPAVELPTPETVTEAPVTPKAAYTMDELSTAAMPLLDGGKLQQQLVSLLNDTFGVPALPMLPKEQYDAFAAAIREMGAQI